MEKFALWRRNSQVRAELHQKLVLTPEIAALYFLCLAGKTFQIGTSERQIIVQVFDRQFPELTRTGRPFLRRAMLILVVVIGILLLLGLLTKEGL